MQLHQHQLAIKRTAVMIEGGENGSSDLLAENSSRAAAFRTDCNLCTSVTGKPADAELQ